MHKLTLNDDQEKASAIFTDFLIDDTAKYMVIMGPAGSGKTTLVRSLLATMKSRLKLYTLLLGSKDEVPSFTTELTATTNKAVAVLSKLSGKECMTVHSRLGLVPQEDYSTGKVNFVRGIKHAPIYNTLLVIDEASFIDDDLFQTIDTSTVNCKILFIGDQYQLAPVNQTVPIMDKVKGHIVRLDKIMRHGGAIAEASGRFRETVKTGIFAPIFVDGEAIMHVNGPTFQAMIDKAKAIIRSIGTQIKLNDSSRQLN